MVKPSSEMRHMEKCYIVDLRVWIQHYLPLTAVICLLCKVLAYIWLKRDNYVKSLRIVSGCAM